VFVSQVLEELLKTHDDDVDYYKIMSLGKHYSQKWLAEDMEQERKDGQYNHTPPGNTPLLEIHPSSWI